MCTHAGYNVISGSLKSGVTRRAARDRASTVEIAAAAVSGTARECRRAATCKPGSVGENKSTCSLGDNGDQVVGGGGHAAATQPNCLRPERYAGLAALTKNTSQVPTVTGLFNGCNVKRPIRRRDKVLAVRHCRTGKCIARTSWSERRRGAQLQTSTSGPNVTSSIPLISRKRRLWAAIFGRSARKRNASPAASLYGQHGQRGEYSTTRRELLKPEAARQPAARRSCAEHKLPGKTPVINIHVRKNLIQVCWDWLPWTRVLPVRKSQITFLGGFCTVSKMFLCKLKSQPALNCGVLQAKISLSLYIYICLWGTL